MYLVINKLVSSLHGAKTKIKLFILNNEIMRNLKTFSNKTDIEIYLEYVNDWLTTKRMSEAYDVPLRRLQAHISKGKKDYATKYNLSLSDMTYPSRSVG